MLACSFMHSVPSCLDACVAFFNPCDDATAHAAEVADRLESRALRTAGDYDRVALIPAIRVFGCALPPAARGPDVPGEVVPPGCSGCPCWSGPALAGVLAPINGCDSALRASLLFWPTTSWGLPGLAGPVAIHYPVWVISLDVAIDAKLCDLSCSGGIELPAGLTLPLPGVLLWCLVYHHARLGALPSGMVALEPRALGPARSGLPCICGACTI